MTPIHKLLITLAAAIALTATVAAVAGARMQSERLDKGLCETTGGGRFVGIPGFPGERIDRRLLRDVKLLVRRYKIFITDGYSTDPVHSAKGEHPIGLALDIVPDRAAGGTWKDIGRLARWAEPKQNSPRAPFRWVGYNGDAVHGRGHHLHLSWAHSRGKFGKPVRTAYSVRCPNTKAPEPTPEPDPPKPTPDRNKPKGKGGISPTKGISQERSAGGISYKRAERKIKRQQRSTTSRERGGIGLG